MEDINSLTKELEHHTPFDAELEYEIDQEEQLTDFEGDLYVNFKEVA